MPRGRLLIQDIDSCAPTAAELALWWLGQHGFVLKLGRSVLYIDAFLTDTELRQVPPLLHPQDVTNADLILGTHDHEDHIDRAAWPVIAAASPRARFIVPELLRRKLSNELKIPADRFAGLDDGQSIEIGGVRITGIAAAHEFLDRDPATGRHPYLGYVMEGGGAVIYHCGDCCIYEGLQTKLSKWAFDLMLVPINGRDAVRLAAGCIGNMTYQEAADLAGALRPRCTIPTHYDMFAANSADPRLFVDYMRVKYPYLPVRICEHGVRLTIAAVGQ